MNSMDDRLFVFTTSPTRHLFSQRNDCTFMSLYHPNFLKKIESWNVYFGDESISSFL